jgi:EAL domain-containing protein (putative c-di-GMP-specific phosphodiesterase class I)
LLILNGSIISPIMPCAINPHWRSRLIVEITETEAIRDVEGTKTFVDSMHDLGCKVALDDFGAGFTSYRNLRDLGVDMVKIDGSFMNNLGQQRTRSDVRTHTDRAWPNQWTSRQLLNGSKQPEDAELLREWGINYMQGHLFGHGGLARKG